MMTGTPPREDRGRLDDLLAQARRGERAALARLLSIVERGGDQAQHVGRAAVAEGTAIGRVADGGSSAVVGARVNDDTGVAKAAAGGTGADEASDSHTDGDVAAGVASLADSYTVGVTGAPGAGKSTLTSALVGVVRSRGERVAVLAIDPSSPFSGGAILGDRVRMGEHALDDSVFIRSMASRGHLGGLAVAAPEAVRVLAAVGFAYVLLETVGVGQAEVEVASHADTTVVVVNPGWGDAVQASKAGLLEIADVFVVNKADRPGADEAARDLERVLDMAGTGPADWRPPVVRTTATTGNGVADVWDAVGKHRAHLLAGDGLAERRRRRARQEVTRLVTGRLAARADALTAGNRADELVAAVAEGRLDPWSAADQLLGTE